ncbi:unnamed protein product [Arabis nemorensis]|uniref:Uncharacterized protein n=1 Tax=Arabis nemorensis TaxID=586526 RepID=A0A565CA84_9BRAS|nr:unnamed protein product [Arabis nemorensis]
MVCITEERYEGNIVADSDCSCDTESRCYTGRSGEGEFGTSEDDEKDGIFGQEEIYESEEEDYDYDGWNGFVRNDKYVGADIVSDEDDFVEAATNTTRNDNPAMNKMRLSAAEKGKGIVVEEQQVRVRLEIPEGLKKRISVTEIYGYEDVEPIVRGVYSDEITG